jgi:molybdopterin converting factor subunit 1
VRIRVRYFGQAREAAGIPEEELELMPGATIRDAVAAIWTRHPELERMRHVLRVAVNRRLAQDEQELSERDEVALLPPVSGGSGLVLSSRVTRQPIEIGKLLEAVRDDEAGAVVIFLGRVRANSDGRRVREIVYECYDEMAEERLREVEEEAKRAWPISSMAVVHRVGRLKVGEISVAVAVASAHRQEAFEACRQAMERIKREVPIWKKEVYEGGGARWVEGHIIE